jgi:hypothetical protein
MNKKEKELAAKMLDLASEQFSNHGCDEVEESVYDGWTREERLQFVKEFHEWNGDPEEFSEDMLHLGDSTLMAYFASKLRNEAK